MGKKNNTISFPESTGSTVSGWSPGGTLGTWNFLPQKSGVPVLVRMLCRKNGSEKLEKKKTKAQESKGNSELYSLDIQIVKSSGSTLLWVI